MLFLLILDSLGTSELMLILVVALIFFGPRKLPQISRQIGKSLAEFRKASDDFKRTWEREVAMETQLDPEPRTIFPPSESVIDTTVERGADLHHSYEGATALPEAQTNPEATATTSAPSTSTMQSPRKQDWL